MAEAKMTQADCDRMKREKANKQTQLNNARSKNQQIDKKIEALREAYTKIIKKRESYRSLKDEEKKFLQGKKLDRKWKGSLYDAYNGTYAASVIQNGQSYYSYLDKQIMDKINSEINRLRNQKYSDTFLGNLQKGINDLDTKIRNFLNIKV